jgi:hypothetical protein
MLMPVLTPHGVLTLRRDGEAPEFEPAQDSRLEQAFRRGPGHGLLALGASEVATALPAVLSYWRDFGARDELRTHGKARELEAEVAMWFGAAEAADAEEDKRATSIVARRSGSGCCGLLRRPLLGISIAGDSWRSWRGLMIAAIDEEFSEDERKIFAELTGRVRERQRVDEFAAAIGRRGGKSRAMATLAT